VTEAELKQALADSIAETLEAMFFTSCLEAVETTPQSGLEMVARVEFEGHPSGRLTVRMAARTARAIAAGFLGEDEDAISPRQVADVLCELTNMICGFVLSRVESAEGFRLREPRLTPAAGLETAAGRGESAAVRIAHAVETGAGALEAALEMDGGVCPP